MRTQLRKIGNSSGAIIPSNILKTLNLAEGDHIEVSTEDGRIVIAPVTPKTKYVLADLIAQCNPAAPINPDLIAWDQAPSVGNEF